MWLLVLFLAVPLIEIALFIQIGGFIGLWPTLLIVVVTAIAGTWLVRAQGRLAIGQLQRSFERLDDPTEPLAHGAMILIAGALLLTPGFFTDAVGFALLVPPVRRQAFLYLRKRIRGGGFSMGGTVHVDIQGHRRPGGHPGQPGGPTIDGEYEEVRPASAGGDAADRDALTDKTPTHPANRQTRH
jgi:UPF0716 protein FxsA